MLVNKSLLNKFFHKFVIPSFPRNLKSESFFCCSFVLVRFSRRPLLATDLHQWFPTCTVLQRCLDSVVSGYSINVAGLCGRWSANTSLSSAGAPFQHFGSQTSPLCQRMSTSNLPSPGIATSTSRELCWNNYFWFHTSTVLSIAR